MNSLAEAFKTIQNGEKVDPTSMFALPETLWLDPRLEDEVCDLVEKKIPHNLIRFILRELIEKPGPLIDENILAARLGIDLRRSEAWPELRDENLSAFSYKGILHDGWGRWWAEGFENWWKSNIPGTNPQGRTAKQRVKLLVEKTGLAGLVTAEKHANNFSTEYWTTCVITKLPLDPVDGFRVIPSPSFPWQDERFLSPIGFLDRFEEFKKNGFRLNPIEKGKWQSLRKNSK